MHVCNLTASIFCSPVKWFFFQPIILRVPGRGVTEYYNCDVTDIDWICGSLETSIGTVGGFCCGASYVIDHQRLSGSGYCFSASAPPLLSVAAIQALDIVENEPQLFASLSENSKLLHEKMSSLNSVVCIRLEATRVGNL